MVAARYAYSKGKSLARRISAAFALVFGLLALIVSPAPKLWGSRNVHQVFSLTNMFSQNTVHADTPHVGIDGGYDANSGDACASDAACGSDCGGGSCAGADANGGGCSVGDASA